MKPPKIKANKNSSFKSNSEVPKVINSQGLYIKTRSLAQKQKIIKCNISEPLEKC